MRRSGFTMVELIFVIVIIGILAATALPKFNGVRDRAKIANEISSLSSMDAVITAAKEFRYEDNSDDNISWHDSGLANLSGDGSTQATEYITINSNKDVLKKIAKKSKDIKIVGLFSSDGNEINATSDTTPYKDSLLILTSSASNAKSGVVADSTLPGKDALGKPDKNDVWVFNPNNWDVNITSDTVPLHTNTIVVAAQSIVLVDVNNTDTTDVSKLKAVRSDSVRAPQSATKLN